MLYFDIIADLPRYTPEEAEQMHMDERFQEEAARACNAIRTVVNPGHPDGDAYVRVAHFASSGEVNDSFFRRMLQTVTPQVAYLETSRYYTPPQGAVEIQVLTPRMASNCVAIHADLYFQPNATGTTRVLRTTVEVSNWVPFHDRAEQLIAAQLQTRLAVGAEYAQRWAMANPDLYRSVTQADGLEQPSVEVVKPADLSPNDPPSGALTVTSPAHATPTPPTHAAEAPENPPPGPTTDRADNEATDPEAGNEGATPQAPSPEVSRTQRMQQALR